MEVAHEITLALSDNDQLGRRRPLAGQDRTGGMPENNRCPSAKPVRIRGLHLFPQHGLRPLHGGLARPIDVSVELAARAWKTSMRAA
jgi:hypothetical protein